MGKFLKTFQKILKTKKLTLPVKGSLPTRNEQIKNLVLDKFDVLVIGGGATGAGCALDAATRGLKTALIEYNDFSSATSSKSTKLVHGGMRYLQKAISKFDKEQFNMVKEALHERENVLKSAPHLARTLPILLPVYKWWQLPYLWFGVKMYDRVAGMKKLKPSYVLCKKGAIKAFPLLKSDKLVGAIVYYDGQHDDARMNVAIALTAARYGATIANHISVRSLIKTCRLSNLEVTGALVRDELTGKEWKICADCVINATGPFVDCVRRMDDINVQDICAPTSGAHVVLPSFYCASNMGLLDPKSSDDRVIFILPWRNKTIVGTTDNPCNITFQPKATEEEICFLLNEIKTFYNHDLKVRREDILSAWSGIRGLISDPKKKDTQSLVRNHFIEVSRSKLITIAGGKWTTYRTMAKATIDRAIKECELKPKYAECRTKGILLEGADGWRPTLHVHLIQKYGLRTDVAKHLTSFYGDKASDVLEMGDGCPVKLHPDYPFIENEVRYGVREYGVTAVDMIARRLRIAFLDPQVALDILPRIIDIMGEELCWTHAQKLTQRIKAIGFLYNEMGMPGCSG